MNKYCFNVNRKVLHLFDILILTMVLLLRLCRLGRGRLIIGLAIICNLCVRVFLLSKGCLGFRGTCRPGVGIGGGTGLV